MMPYVIYLNSITEAKFAYNFFRDIVMVAFNYNYVVFSVHPDIVFVYKFDMLWSEIVSIFLNENIKKITLKPIEWLPTSLPNSNSVLLSSCIDYNSLILFNNDILSLGFVKDVSDLDLIIKSVSNMWKYIDMSSKQQTCGNYRNCYLMYLTIFNDILYKIGPTPFMGLAQAARDYPYICNVSLHPCMALEALIHVGLLCNETDTTLVSIPDQIP